MRIKSDIAQIMNRNWDEVSRLFPYSDAMSACIQDPIYHAEGDVWTHTKMVWDSLREVDSSASMALTALYHDVAKPETRTEEPREGRIHIGHPSHSRIGAQIAWRDMWLNNIGNLAEKLKIYRQIRAHQKIFHMWSNSDPLRQILSYNVDSDIFDLIKFAKADNIGRICPNQQETQESLDLLGLYATEENVSLRFTSPASRLFYFEKPSRSPDYSTMPASGSRVVMMCGLPGSGKDTYISSALHGLPVISLDAIRENLGIKHGDNQGQVIQSAQETAREFLRKKSPFVWNSTNLTKSIRSKIIKLFRDYDAYVSIHMTVTPFATLMHQNKSRKDMVPEDAINNMLFKWEPPSLTEVHEIKYIGENK